MPFIHPARTYTGSPINHAIFTTPAPRGPVIRTAAVSENDSISTEPPPPQDLRNAKCEEKNRVRIHTTYHMRFVDPQPKTLITPYMRLAEKSMHTRALNFRRHANRVGVVCTRRESGWVHFFFRSHDKERKRAAAASTPLPKFDDPSCARRFTYVYMCVYVRLR